MTLYHGSNLEVMEPRLLKSSHTLDFGPGFYTTLNRDQAVNFARRVARNRQSGVATLNVYHIDEDIAFPPCKVVRFDGVSDAWLDFVCANRGGAYEGPAYDFAYGPVANDDVYATLQVYRSGILTREEALRRLKVKQLFNQLVFASEKALGFIRFVSSEDVHD